MKVFAYMQTRGGLTGAPRRLLTLASCLRKQDIEMRIATQRDSDLCRAAEQQGLRTASADPVGVLARQQGALFGGGALFRLKVVVSLLAHNFSIARNIRKYQSDVVWVRGSKGVAFAALGALLIRRPLIWDVDSELPSLGIVRWLHRFGLWASSTVVFQYAAAPYAIFGDQLARFYASKFKTIVPGVELSRLERYRLERYDRKIKGNKPFTILQVGTICDRKNQFLIIEALERLKKSGRLNRVLLQFAGEVVDEEYSKGIRQKTLEAGLEDVVEWLGWRDDVHDLMVKADLLVMPSKDEGVPNTVQEAMYIGLPVLVSEAGGMPEIVKDKDTGWVLPMGHPELWEEHIACCLEDPPACESVGRRGSVYANLHFGTESWGKIYGDIVRRL